MATEGRYDALADQVVGCLGGKDNIEHVTYCMTRLRFTVRDKDAVDVAHAEALSGVLGSAWSGNQFQLIIGQTVSDAYAAVCARNGFEAEAPVDAEEPASDAEPRKRKISISAFFDFITGCVTPVLPILTAGGFFKILLALGTQFGLLTTDMPTYVVLNFVGDAAFYFLGIFVGCSTARRVGANEYLGMLIGAILIHPNFVSAVADGSALDVFGLPIYPATYSYSIIPIILSVAVMAPIEKFIAKHARDAVRGIMEPFFTILIMVPLALCVLGPAGAFLSNYIIDAVVWVYNTFGWVGVAIFACIHPLLVSTGMHQALTPYLTQSFATVGKEYIAFPGMTVANIDQGMACLAVSLKTKNARVKELAGSAAIQAIIGGITEPALFGINLRYKTPLYGCMIGSLIGGAIVGIGGGTANVMAGGSLLQMVTFLGGTMSSFIWACVGVAVGAIITFVATLFMYHDVEEA